VRIRDKQLAPTIGGRLVTVCAKNVCCSVLVVKVNAAPVFPTWKIAPPLSVQTFTAWKERERERRGQEEKEEEGAEGPCKANVMNEEE